jgi:hypothetical protein
MWGGLGSQLFAWALFEDLASAFPNRKIVLVHHSSGVTQRASELEFYFPGQVIAVNDWKGSSNEPTERGKSLRPLLDLRFQIRKLAEIVGAISSSNTNEEFAQMKPWVLAIRGHYSYRTISQKTISKMYQRSKNMGKPLFSDYNYNSDSIAFHYRLGDLMILTEKSPISIERLMKLFQNPSIQNRNRLVLFSDTLSQALKNLKTFATSHQVVTKELNPLETLIELTKFNNFIGTNSKITIWAVLLISFKKEGNWIMLPQEFKNQIQYNLDSVSGLELINYY